MALATPIEVPIGLVFNSKVFDIGRYEQVSPGGAGFIQTIQRSEPLWYAQYNTPPLRDDRYDQTIAFLLALEGATETFLAYDPRRPMPRAYAGLPITSDPWTLVGQTSPRVTATNFANSTLTLDRMATGAVVTSGDYISFQIGKIWYLYRVQVGGIVTGTNSLVVTVKPRPNLYTGATTLPAAVRYRRACFQAKVIGGYQEEDSVDTLPKFGFKCFQMLDRS
jgi:hypothetical protein